MTLDGLQGRFRQGVEGYESENHWEGNGLNRDTEARVSPSCSRLPCRDDSGQPRVAVRLKPSGNWKNGTLDKRSGARMRI
jgi:hypothetical protein